MSRSILWFPGSKKREGWWPKLLKADVRIRDPNPVREEAGFRNHQELVRSGRTRGVHR